MSTLSVATTNSSIRNDDDDDDNGGHRQQQQQLEQRRHSATMPNKDLMSVFTITIIEAAPRIRTSLLYFILFCFNDTDGGGCHHYHHQQ